MKQTNQTAALRQFGDFGAVNYTIIAASSGALLATFLLGYANFGFVVEVTVFAAILIVYLSICAAVYFRSKMKSKVADAEESPELSEEIENRLRALEEASEFFGASLKPADMFRLIASRVNELIPFATCVLFGDSENYGKLKVEFAAGTESPAWKNVEIASKNGVAGQSFASRQIEYDENLSLDKTVIPSSLLSNFQSAAAVPLVRDDRVFAVFQIYFIEKKRFAESERTLLESVGERIAPLMASSMSFEISLSNALTDALTNLPNQRAFFLVLENQIAESARYQSERALSVLAIDIKNFDDLNHKFGHATADRILAFAGENIKTQLRQMDFLARSGSDEFLAVLPTASKNISMQIIERIERVFAEKYFGIDETEKVFVELHFGAATFGADGETAPQLLKNAVWRKQQSKSDEAGKVLWFPKEFVS